MIIQIVALSMYRFLFEKQIQPFELVIHLGNILINNCRRMHFINSTARHHADILLAQLHLNGLEQFSFGRITVQRITILFGPSDNGSQTMQI